MEVEKMAHKYVYKFGAGNAEGNKDMKLLLGGKGANLAEMSNLGIPVPPVLQFLQKFAKCTMKIMVNSLKKWKNRYWKVLSTLKNYGCKIRRS